MPEIIADLHTHSKYARACSPLLELPAMARAASEKGIQLLSTGDFTHPRWMEHLEENLVEIGTSGLYKMKNEELRMKNQLANVQFIFGTEISCIYRHNDKTRRIHLLVYASNLAVAKQFNAALEARGAKLAADGRPIIGMSAKEVIKIAIEVDERMMVIPAHAWTPWFAVFGSKSGYDSLEECFEELTPHIFAIETGLSSDPPMNHRLSKLDNIVLISNSDAHSLDNLGREANVFNFENEADVTYDEIRRILKERDRKKFLYTIEFYPEEGMYHFDGHRDCKFSSTPEETKRNKAICPVCKKKVTIGVLYRVDELADRPAESIIDKNPVPEQSSARGKFIPHRYLVPLREIIAASFEVGKKSKKVEEEYRRLILALGSEFEILLHRSVAQIEQITSDKNIAFGIQNMREGKVKIVPGFDGQYGVVNPFPTEKLLGPAQSRLFE